MTKSMTAFARSESGNIIWEIRSVNHRYLDGTFKIPEAYRSLESNLRNQLRSKLNRGKVDCLLRINMDAEEGGSFTVDEEQLENLKTALNKVSNALEKTSAINPLEVLKWPGILSALEVDQSQLESTVKQCFDEALSSLQAMRTREGEELKGILLNKLDELCKIVDAVRLEAPLIVEKQSQKVISRLEDLKQEVDQNRLEQELVYLAQKSDIMEELDRLDTHVEEVRSALAQKGAVGRRLDFLMQELNREANTLSSKAVAANTSIQAVELKVIIEQMREQVQNIE